MAGSQVTGSTAASDEPSRARRQSFREVVSRAIISSVLDFRSYHGHDNSLSHDVESHPMEISKQTGVCEY